MAKASKRVTNETKGRIVSAAWKLFYQYGYNNTTIDDIVEESNTSKGSFYHYFSSKDDLMGSLSPTSSTRSTRSWPKPWTLPCRRSIN